MGDEHRDEDGKLTHDPDAEPWDAATDDPKGRVRLPPNKKEEVDPKQSKLKLTSHERAFRGGWDVLKLYGPDFFDSDKKAKRQATKGTECSECGMPKRTSTNRMILTDGEMCDCANE